MMTVGGLPISQSVQWGGQFFSRIQFGWSDLEVVLVLVLLT